MALQGARIGGVNAQPGGEVGLSDCFLSLATSVVTTTTNGNYIDLRNYTHFEVIAFFTADVGTPTRVVIQAEKATTLAGASPEVMDGEMVIEAGNLQANGRTPVCNLYEVDEAKPFVRLRGEQTAGTSATLTAVIRGLNRISGNQQRFIVEGLKVAEDTAGTH